MSQPGELVQLQSGFHVIPSAIPEDSRILSTDAAIPLSADNVVASEKSDYQIADNPSIRPENQTSEVSDNTFNYVDEPLDTKRLGIISRITKNRVVRSLIVTLTVLSISNSSSLASAELSTSRKNMARIEVKPNSGTRVNTSCSNAGSDPVSLEYVDHSILPFASEFIRMYQHAKASEKRSLKASEISAYSYSGVTEKDIYIPARSSNGVKGTYLLLADFAGSTIPRHMVALAVEEYAGVLGPGIIQNKPSEYQYVLGRTTRDGLSNNIGMHWVITVAYAKHSLLHYHDFSSETESGLIDSSLGNMTLARYESSNNQAQTIIDRAKLKKPIVPLSYISSASLPAQDC